METGGSKILKNVQDFAFQEQGNQVPGGKRGRGPLLVLMGGFDGVSDSMTGRAGRELITLDQ